MTVPADPETHSWREPVLRHFTPDIARVAGVTVVSDPDGMLGEQRLLEAFRIAGFDLLGYDDPVAFRLVYEGRYRTAWDAGKATHPLVVSTSLADAERLPYDLLQMARRNGRVLSFSLGELFPDLAPAPLIELDRTDLDALYQAQRTHPPGQRLGENATREFILRHVFEVAPELVKTAADLLRVLLRHHYRRRRFPESLATRLVSLLRQNGSLEIWPLDALVRSREAFLAFLQERWPVFLSHRLNVPLPRYGDGTSPPPEPALLPFDHDDIRVYVDDLFVEGLLQPTDVIPADHAAETWMAVGIRGSAKNEPATRFRELSRLIEANLPDESAAHAAWLEAAWRWAEWIVLRWSLDAQGLGESGVGVEQLHDRVERAFSAWMRSHYSSLSSQSYWPQPVMLHHVAPFLAHTLRSAGTAERVALVVVDGLALDQWLLLQDALTEVDCGVVERSGVFAWVPTITSVSRQAIFAAELPQFFAPSLHTTQKEPQHWLRFWENQRLSRAEVAYVRQGSQEPDASLLAHVQEAAEPPRRRVLGVVVGVVDEAMHGNPLGTGGLHAQVRHWASTGCFNRLVRSLLDLGYAVFVTADHGNIEGSGIGKPNVGDVANSRGERVHVFPDVRTMHSTCTDFPDAIQWPQIGLPDDYFALLAPDRKAFIPKGKRTVGHGGIALEEVIVPFVHIGRRP